MASKAVYFDGVHCRDSQGKFVPVPQCRGKRKKRTGNTKGLGETFSIEDITTPLRFPVSKQKLAPRIQTYMRSIAVALPRSTGERYEAIKARLFGMEELAWRIGVNCSCSELTLPLRYVCRCRPKTLSEERMQG